VLLYLHLINLNFSSRCTQICYNKSRNFVLLISRSCARLKLESCTTCENLKTQVKLCERQS